MKHLIFAIIFCLLAPGLLSQVNRSIPPVGGPAPKINMGEYKKFKLRNGLQVFVVENNELPIVSYSLTLEIDPGLEGDAAGYGALAGSLMRSGTKSRDKAQIDNAIDFIGATLSTSSRGMYGVSLKKHGNALLEIMSDVLLNPTFPLEELEKSVRQMNSALQVGRDDPETIAGNVSKVLLYGPDDPYGEIVTENTLANITVDKLKGFHHTFFRPNVAYLVIVGDITLKEARAQARKYFGKWKQAPVPRSFFELPESYHQPKVAVSSKTGANQSTIMVTHAVNLTPWHPDAIKASVMNQVLGGGSFNARLFQNLREDKGFTYGAYSSLNSDKRIGSFTASTQVRTSVTDSAISEILHEMVRMRTELVSDNDLDLIKNMMSGSFSRSLEDPRTIARFALNVERYNLPADYYTTYLEKLAAVTAVDVKEMANKYLHPGNAIILAVGDVERIAGVMSHFARDGEVMEYDFFGNQVKKSAIPKGVTAQGIIENYIRAIGGEKLLRSVSDVKIKGSMVVQGMPIELYTIQKAPGKFYMELKMGENMLSRQVFDGTKGKIYTPAGIQVPEGSMLDEMKESAIMFPELEFASNGTRMELKGLEELDGKQVYKIEVFKPSGNKSTLYFNFTDGLKYREINVSPRGIVTTSYLNYKAIDGIKFPMTMKTNMGQQGFDVEISSIEVNTGVDDSMFAN